MTLRVEALRRPGLGPVSFTVAAGTGLAVTGASGAGKSLLLRALADLDPYEGRVWLDDLGVHELPAPQWRRRVVYVPATSGWWGERVGDHVPGRAEERRSHCHSMAILITRLGLPGEAVFDWQVARLSTGERQRLALARSLCLDPPVLLLDEPTAALDPATIDRVEAVLVERLHRGVVLVMVTHDPAQAVRLTQQQLILQDGRVVYQGATRATHKDGMTDS